LPAQFHILSSSANPEQAPSDTLVPHNAKSIEQALALLRRAQPFPPPPRELAGDHIDLTVPIRFNLK